MLKKFIEMSIMTKFNVLSTNCGQTKCSV